MSRYLLETPEALETFRARPAREGSARLAVLIACFCLFLLGRADGARALGVRAWVDKTEASLEDQILLTVSISGERRMATQPTLPPLPDFRVSQGGTTSRTEIINGTIRTSVEITYVLTPLRAGTFTIGPVTVERKGRTFQTEPISVRILPLDAQPARPRPAFVTQQVDVKDPFVHQQVVYTFRFFRRVQTLEAEWDPPSFNGFWVEDLGKERQYEKVIQGERYAVTEVRKALFPLSEGPIRIDESLLVCKLAMPDRHRPRGLFDDSFFPSSLFGGYTRTVTRTLHAQPIEIHVRPLPETGRPENFSGLVGTFQVQASIGQEQLRVGDSTTLTVTVTGTGNLRDLVSVPPEAIPGFKVYSDKPRFDLLVRGKTVEARKVFKKALVPLKEGLLEVPSQVITYFDPERGAYRAAKTEPFRLAVQKSLETEPLHLVTASGLAGTKATIKVLGKDILPIHTGLAGASTQVPSGTILYAYVGMCLLPPCIFMVCYATKRRQERLETNRHLVRRKQARSKANRVLKEARKRADSAGDKEFLRQLSRGVKGLIGDKMNLAALAYTPVEIERCMLDNGVPKETAREVRAFLEQLETEQYGSAGMEAAGNKETRYKQAKRLVAQLDRKL